MQMLQKETPSITKRSRPTKRGRQRQAIFRHIVQTMCVKGMAPNIREIQDALAIHSSGTVHYHLEQLVAHGWIIRTPGKERHLVVPWIWAMAEIAEVSLRLISAPFQHMPSRLTLQICSTVYQSEEHLCVGDVITVTPGVSDDGQLLVVLHCSIQTHPFLTLVRVKKQSASSPLSLHLPENGNGPQASLLLSQETWERDWIILGAVTSVLRSFFS